MRFGKFFGHEAIPQWKECYLDYTKLKEIIQLLKKLVEILHLILYFKQKMQPKRALSNRNDHTQQNIIDEQINHNFTILQNQQVAQNAANANAQNQQNTFVHSTKLNELLFQCQQYLNNVNRFFFQFYTKDIQIIELFYQMKVLQMFQNCLPAMQIAEKQLSASTKEKLLSLIEYLYIQVIYVNEMRIANKQACRKIIKKHKKNVKKCVPSPQLAYQKLQRLQDVQCKQIQKLEDVYVKNCPMENPRQYLRSVSKRTGIQPSQAFVAGTWLGISIALLFALIFIIVYKGLSIETVSVFSRDFPTWRGAALFIFYIWILCFNVYLFQKYKINHSLIFNFQDHHQSTSAYIFRLAGSFTTLYIILFFLYLLQTGLGLPLPINSYHLVSFIWGSLILYMVNPFPIGNRKGRLYALVLCFKSITSPITGVAFPIIWMTDQWISLATPLRDLVYTICYYRELDLDDSSKANPCLNNTNFSLIVIVSIVPLCLRMVQCMRLGYQQGSYFASNNLINTLKYLVSTITVLFAFFVKENPSLLPGWVVFLILATLFSYLWDIRMDWALLQQNHKHLRKYITFPKPSYYALIALNLLLRCAWIISLTPTLINSALLGLLTALIQIFRRGVWNLLRVERQHITNCAGFRALPDLTALKTQLCQLEGIQIKQDNKQKQDFLALIAKRISEKQTFIYVYDKQSFQKQKKNIKKLQEKVRNLIKNNAQKQE